MLNIDEIQNGIVIDHIKAGTAIGLMDLLGIAGNRTASVALIQNARSKKTASGRKDIIKVEGDASWLNLDVLAYLDPNISVTIIENGKAVRKEQPKPPKRLVNIVRCKNPRCISSIEEECDQIFELSSNGKYRCIYCEQELQVKRAWLSCFFTGGMQRKTAAAALVSYGNSRAAGKFPTNQQRIPRANRCTKKASHHRKLFYPLAYRVKVFL